MVSSLLQKLEGKKPKIILTPVFMSQWSPTSRGGERPALAEPSCVLGSHVHQCLPDLSMKILPSCLCNIGQIDVRLVSWLFGHWCAKRGSLSGTLFWSSLRGRDAVETFVAPAARSSHGLFRWRYRVAPACVIVFTIFCDPFVVHALNYSTVVASAV